MDKVFAQRLKSARKMKGVSMDELCNMIGNIVSKQSISKYENGKMQPDSTVLIALSNALGVNVDYFFRPYQLELPTVEFRKKSSLKIGDIDSIKEKVIDAIERHFEIKDILEINHKFSIDFSNITIQSSDDVKSLAKRLRNEWKLGEDAIVNVINMLEENNVNVIELDVAGGFDGLSGFVNQTDPIIVLNKNHPAERQRFTALHELGHLILRFDPTVSHTERERYCNLFASEMLIPSSQFVRKIGSSRKGISLMELIPIQEQYGISIDALMVKAKELNIVSEQRYKAYWIKKNQYPELKNEINESRYSKESSHRFFGLVYRAVASEIISYSKASALLGVSINEIRSSLNFV